MTAEMEDVKINVKLKISALWITIMFAFAYVDIFGFVKTGEIEGIIAGKMATIWQYCRKFTIIVDYLVCLEMAQEGRES